MACPNFWAQAGIVLVAIELTIVGAKKADIFEAKSPLGQMWNHVNIILA